MPLREQKTPIPLSGGMTDGTDSLLIAPPAMADVVDYEFAKDGTLNKVAGAAALSASGIPNSLDINSLHVNGAELMAVQPGLASGLSRYLPLSNTWKRTPLGGVWPITTSFDWMRRGQFDVSDASCAHLSGFTCWVWVEGYVGAGYPATAASARGYYMVIEESTGSVILGPTQLAHAVLGVKVVAVDAATNHFIIAMQHSDLDIWAVRLDISSTTVTVGITETLAQAHDGTWDICTLKDKSKWFLAIKGAAGLTVYEKATSALGTIVQSHNIAAPAGGAGPILELLHWHGGALNNSWILVIYTPTAGTTAYIAAMDEALTTTLGDALIANNASADEPYGRGALVQNDSDFTGWLVLTRMVDVPVGSGTPLYRAGLSSQAIKISGILATIANTNHEIAGIGLIGRGFYHANYGPVFPMATPDNAGGYTLVRRGADPITPTSLIETVSHTPFGGNGFLVAFYTDFGGAEPTGILGEDAGGAEEGTPAAAGTANERAVAIARFAVDRLGYGRTDWVSTLPTHADLSTAQFILPLISVFAFEIDGYAYVGGFGSTEVVSDPQYGMAKAVVDMADTTPLRGQELGDSFLIAGGQLTTFDQQIGLELGPLTQPFIVGITEVTEDAGGPLGWPEDSDVFIEVMFRWRDAQGQLHRSTPSTVRGIARGDFILQATIAVLVPPEVYLHRDQNFYKDFELELYASTPGSATPILRQVVLVRKNIGAGFGQYSCFETTVGAGNSDLTSSTSYTARRELGASVVPPALDILAAKGRLWMINRDRPDQVWWSKPLVDGIAPEFNATQSANVPEDRAGFTALAEQDDKVLLFTDDKLYYLAGEGPDANGRGSFVGPKLVQTDCGCISRASIARCPAGTVFFSKRGFMLFGRDTSLTYIGAGVEDHIDPESDVINAAVLVPGHSQIRFLVQPNGGDTFQLIWDYERSAWARTSTRSGPSIQHGVLWQDEFTRVQSTVVYQETSGSFSDPGATILPTFTTGWISLDGLEGFAKLWKLLILGRYYTGNIQVSIGYDYEDTFTDVRTWTEAVDFVGQAGKAIRLPIIPSKQPHTAFRVKIEETSGDNATTGAFFTASGFGLEWGQRRSGDKHYARSLQK